ncbi:MAG: hypothetical protein HY000_00200 [Planctomycetes bacterium]|nr:hypothetical protein [Planctomycetota bacterium]
MTGWRSSIKAHYRILLAIAVFALISAAWVGYRRWSAAYSAAQAELDREIARIKSRREPAWFRDCQPLLLPTKENAAPLIQAARGAYVKPPQEFWQLSGREEGPPPPPGDYALFRAALTDNQPALAVMRQALARPKCQFSYDYRTDQPWAILLRDVDMIGQFSWLLRTDVLQSLGTGNPDRAIAATDEQLDLARLLESEPFIVSHMVLHRVARQGIDSLQDVLARRQLDERRFAVLDRRLMRLQSTAKLERVVLTERAISLSTMQSVGSPGFRTDVLDFEPARKGGSGPASSNELDRYALRIKNEVKNRGWASAAYRPWLMRNQVFVLRTLADFAETVDQLGPEGAAAFTRMNDALQAQVSNFPVAELFLGEPQRVLSLERVRRSGLWHRQRLIIARLAIRLARYHSVHKRYPEELAHVAGDMDARALKDLFTAAPLVYRSREDGFMLVALNERGEDDRGIRPAEEVNMGARFEVRRINQQ